MDICCVSGVNFLEKGSPSQALPRQLSQRESQGLRLVAEVLGEMRKFPAVLLPLPLGEVDLRSKDGEGEDAAHIKESPKRRRRFGFSHKYYFSRLSFSK